MLLITILKETDPERLAAQQIWNAQLKTKTRTKKQENQNIHPSFQHTTAKVKLVSICMLSMMGQFLDME